MVFQYVAKKIEEKINFDRMYFPTLFALMGITMALIFFVGELTLGFIGVYKGWMKKRMP